MGKETAQAAAHTENKQTELERTKQQRGRLGRLTRRICSVRVYEYVWGGKGKIYRNTCLRPLSQGLALYFVDFIWRLQV